MPGRCAFLTTEHLDGFVTDDELAHEPFRRLGWDVEQVPWRRLGDPGRFQAVVIRTPWDYPDDPEGFLEALERIELSPARLANPLELVRWNLRKTYLRDLEARGVPVVPTVFREPGSEPQRQRLLEDLASGRLFEELQSDRLVIKPLLGANARDIRVVERDAGGGGSPGSGDFGCGDPGSADLGSGGPGAGWLVQPFVAPVMDEGEYSAIFLGGAHSHTLVKVPADGDFRTQEEHGARLRSVEGRDDVLAAGEAAVAAVTPGPLYARVDLVRLATGQLVVMELELVEPSLYLRMDPGAPDRFARAFQAWMEGE